MSALPASERAVARAPAPNGHAMVWWTALSAASETAPLAATLLLAAGLSVFQLDRQGYGNTYYAAAVKSMLTSWRNFFFAAFDAGGFISVDKPPLGLWTQALSAKLLGFSGLSLFLPQILSGLLAIAVLYWLTRRAFGPLAGLVAAPALAVTPINAVTNRNNTMDSQLVLVLLLAAAAASLAAERGRLRWLLLSGALVGLGYNIKMLQAYPVLPGFVLAYLLWAPLRPRARLAHLTLMGALLLAVSLSWSLVVDLTPASQRPYVGSSGTNSALGLALSYNGLGRLINPVASRLPLLRLPGLTVDLTVAPGFAPGIGAPGLSRLVDPFLAGQASWLLPLALIGLAAATASCLHTATSSADSAAVRRRRVAVTIWGSWLLVWGSYFTIARFYHLYYLVMLGPAIAALTGAGTTVLWERCRRGGGWALVLPAALLANALAQLAILTAYPVWNQRLGPIILGASLAASATLALCRWLPALMPRVLAGAALALGIVTLTIAPTAWAGIAILDGQGGAWLPQAGPSQPFRPGGGQGPTWSVSFPTSFRPNGPGGTTGGPPGRGGPGAFTFAGQRWNSLEPGLVRYLLANQGGARFLVATPTSSYASLFILATDQPAMALGGYQGWDRVLTPQQLAARVAAGEVRFFLLGPADPFRGSELDATADLETWVRSSCALVPADRWRTAGESSTSSTGGAAPGGRFFGPGLGADQPTLALYDCRPTS